MILQISVTILTKNVEASLAATLDSVRDFAEVIVLDNGSSDHTLLIAKQYPHVRIVESHFLGFGPLHNLATAKASHDWILSLDSDEVVSPDLLEEIAALQLDKHSVYEIERYNFYRGRRIKGCGWSPDRVVRLYNRQHFAFSTDQVHEKVQAKKEQIITLKNPLLHTPYRSVSDFLKKMQHYSDLFAQQNSKKVSPFTALLHGTMAFIKSYIIKRGFLDGYRGLLISAYNSHTAFYKYLKLFEKNSN